MSNIEFESKPTHSPNLKSDISIPSSEPKKIRKNLDGQIGHRLLKRYNIQWAIAIEKNVVF